MKDFDCKNCEHVGHPVSDVCLSCIGPHVPPEKLGQNFKLREEKDENLQPEELKTVTVTVVFTQTFTIKLIKNDSIEEQKESIRYLAEEYLMEGLPSRPIIQECDDIDLID